MASPDEIKSAQADTPTGVFVGSIIASGEAETSASTGERLSSFPCSIDYVGPLPAEVQLINPVFYPLEFRRDETS